MGAVSSSGKEESWHLRPTSDPHEDSEDTVMFLVGLGCLGLRFPLWVSDDVMAGIPPFCTISFHRGRCPMRILCRVVGLRSSEMRSSWCGLEGRLCEERSKHEVMRA